MCTLASDDYLQNHDESVPKLFLNEQLLPQSSPKDNAAHEELLQDFTCDCNSPRVDSEHDYKHNSSMEDNNISDDDDTSMLNEYSENISESSQVDSENELDNEDKCAFFNTEMFGESKLTVRDIVLMITAFSL